MGETEKKGHKQGRSARKDQKVVKGGGETDGSAVGRGHRKGREETRVHRRNSSVGNAEKSDQSRKSAESKTAKRKEKKRKRTVELDSDMGVAVGSTEKQQKRAKNLVVEQGAEQGNHVETERKGQKADEGSKTTGRVKNRVKYRDVENSDGGDSTSERGSVCCGDAKMEFFKNLDAYSVDPDYDFDGVEDAEEESAPQESKGHGKRSASQSFLPDFQSATGNAKVRVAADPFSPDKGYMTLKEPSVSKNVLEMFSGECCVCVSVYALCCVRRVKRIVKE